MSAPKEPHQHEHHLITLVVSSLASAAAAVVVHALWPQATLVGAAATPVLVAVFAELLRRPVHHLTVRTSVRPAGRLAVDSAGALQEVRVYRARPQWFSALAVALAAFVVGAGGLTLAETLLHRSVGGRPDATTLFTRSAPHGASAGRPSPTTVVVTTMPDAATTAAPQTTPAPARSKERRSAPRRRSRVAPRRPASQTSPKAAATTPQSPESPGARSALPEASTTPTTTEPLASASP